MKRTDGIPYIIAEVGGNHEGSFEEAKKLLDLAVSANVDAVKFQVYTGESLVNKQEDPDRVKHFDRFSLSTSEYIELADLCREANIDFLASVWSENLLDIFVKYMPFIKVGSGDLTAYPLLKKITSYEKPILLSTGLSTMREVRAAVDFVQRNNSLYLEENMLGVLQCTSMYPIPDSEANLLVLNELKKEFPKAIIGYSDHTVGSCAVEMAFTLGAEVIEVHFTDQREGRDFRDHKVSLTADDIIEYKKRCLNIQQLLGSSIKAPTKSELDNGHLSSFRRAIYYKEDMPIHTVISESDLVALRPAHGLGAECFEQVIGKKLVNDVKALSRVALDDFE